MKRVIFATLLLLIFLLSGCATIIKGGDPQAIQFKSEPSDVKLTIKNLDSGDIISSTKTPQMVLLPKSNGFFRYASYMASFEKEGFEKKDITIEPNVSIWYIGGNLLFGGVLGYLIVDPATGAMWQFSEDQYGVMLNPAGTDPIGFTKDEFKPPYSAEKVCASINNDNINFKSSQSDNTVARLNECIESLDLYTQLSSKGKFQQKNGASSLPPEVIDLKNQTQSIREGNSSFYSLKFDDQVKLRKLNRKLIEISYPDQVPIKLIK